MEQVDDHLSEHFHDKPAPPVTAAPAKDSHNSNVDTSRPFRSVKEAVAIFGEKFLAAEIYNPKTFNFPKQETPYYSPPVHTSASARGESPPEASPINSEDRQSSSNDQFLADALKKLEAELEETKMELKMLKERESEAEVALASLNAELHKNKSKLAQAEADTAAAKAVALMCSSMGHGGEREIMEELIIEKKEDKKRSDSVNRFEPVSATLAQILSINGGEKKKKKNSNINININNINKNKVMKKKPIIPLVGDLFSRKKETSANTLHNPLFSFSLN